MYFLFKAASRYRSDGEMAATLANFGYNSATGVDIPVPTTSPDWWEATPLEVPPPHLIFGVDGSAPLLDNFHTACQFDVYSLKLIHLFAAAGIQFETFPTTIIDYQSNITLSKDYALFHLLERRATVDVGRTMAGHVGRGNLPIVWHPDIFNDPAPLFRVAEYRPWVFIHASMKERLDRVGITGCRYLPYTQLVW